MQNAVTNAPQYMPSLIYVPVIVAIMAIYHIYYIILTVCQN